ncbi:MAG: tripartite tricarboxylate transporter substrate binding protein [Chloroflexota bacterium]
MVAPLVEKELGVPVQVVTKAGAAGQLGLTELAKAKPDGYTIGTTPVPGTNSIYLDPEKKAVFTLKDFAPLALQVVDPAAITVPTNSPYKTLKELVEAAKAKPESIKMATSAKASAAHLGTLEFQKSTGTKFALVHFEGGAQSRTALLGGHVDAHYSWVGENASIVKNGQGRYLGVMDKQRSKFFPDVATMEEQGYKSSWVTAHGYSAPAGTPKEVVDVLSAAFKKAIQSDDLKKRLEETGQEVRYMDPAQYLAFLQDFDRMVQPLIPEAR